MQFTEDTLILFVGTIQNGISHANRNMNFRIVTKNFDA
jgi:hypothetical protein